MISSVGHFIRIPLVFHIGLANQSFDFAVLYGRLKGKGQLREDSKASKELILIVYGDVFVQIET